MVYLFAGLALYALWFLMEMRALEKSINGPA